MGTGHNQNYKNHRSGIKKTRPSKTMSMRGMNCKFVRNQAFAKRGMAKGDKTGGDKDERAAAQKEAQTKLEAKKKLEAQKKIKEAEAAAAAAKLAALSSKKGK